jgi:hypothetical protein
VRATQARGNRLPLPHKAFGSLNFDCWWDADLASDDTNKCLRPVNFPVSGFATLASLLLSLHALRFFLVGEIPHILQGTGKFIRHVKLRPGTATNAAALRKLIDTAYADIKARVENG